MNAATARLIFRELTAEPNTTVLGNTQVDYYLDAGQEALNRRIGFHVEDDTSISTASGTQEYTLPTNFVEALWVEYGSALLERIDQDELRRRGLDWRDESAGTPTHYYIYGRKIGFYPKPNATTTIRIRMISTPAGIASADFEGLAPQDHRIPIYYAVAEWSAAHPDSLLALKRAEQFFARFDAEAEAIAGQYARRMIAR